METTIHLLPEAILTEILARLSLRSIYRCKSVCKTWKSAIETVYFRRVFLSLHQNSTSWSLWCCRRKELIRFYGCKAWYLPKSIASIIPLVRFYSNGLVLIRGYDRHCFVGNPVLQQWVKIPPSPNDSSLVFGLVTRVDDDGVVLSFKVVRFPTPQQWTNNNLLSTMSVFLYSSETGLWTSKIIHCPHQISRCLITGYVTVNGTIYYSNPNQPGVLVAHDFYSESNQFRVIPLPDHPNHSDDGDLKRRALTTSGRFFMCVRKLAQKEETVLKVWRLNNDDSWQLLWKINLPMFIGDYVPMKMHPFGSDIVYLRSNQNRHLVSCNLRTQKNTILKDDDHDYVMNNFRYWARLLKFVLPRWMESMPCPPQVEMIDTTSLLSDPNLRLERRYRRRKLF